VMFMCLSLISLSCIILFCNVYDSNYLLNGLVEAGKQISCPIQLTNKTDGYVAFMVIWNYTSVFTMHFVFLSAHDSAFL
jgi:hypothetical protein